MGIFEVRRRYTDTLWTKYMRIKYEFTCQKCQRIYSPDNTAALQNLGVAHYHKRDHENVRFDEDNTLLLCNIPCHRYFDEHRGEFKDFMLNRLGQQLFDMLELRAHIYKKRDDRADAIIIRQMLKEIEGLSGPA